MNEPTNFNPPRTVPKPICQEQIVDWKDDKPVIGYFYSYHQIREWQLEKEMNRMVRERRSIK